MQSPNMPYPLNRNNDAGGHAIVKCFIYFMGRFGNGIKGFVCLIRNCCSFHILLCYEFSNKQFYIRFNCDILLLCSVVWKILIFQNICISKDFYLLTLVYAGQLMHFQEMDNYLFFFVAQGLENKMLASETGNTCALLDSSWCNNLLAPISGFS